VAGTQELFVMTTNKKPKMGRPALPASEGRNHKLEVRLNETENASIEKASKKAMGSDRKKSEWARGVLLSEASETDLSPRSKKDRNPIRPPKG
jgi:hypothetical protein